MRKNIYFGMPGMRANATELRLQRMRLLVYEVSVARSLVLIRQWVSICHYICGFLSMRLNDVLLLIKFGLGEIQANSAF